jgi:cobalt/nickel transport system permease protein
MTISGSTRLHPRRHLLENTLGNLTQTLESGLFAEQISQRPGAWQGLDARVKLIATLALLVGVGISHQLWVILAVYLLTLAVALASAIPADFFIRRVWLALPFFTGMLVLPALFLTPGPALARLPLGLVITRTGLTSALFLLLRVSTSLSLSLLLLLTTPWHTLLSALAVLRVPEVFILVLGMTYRYIYLLLHTANDMFLSRQSRRVGQLTDAETRRTLASITATLFSKSLALSSEVYLAMESRGFRGRIVTLKPFAMKRQDWSWLAAALVVTALVIYFGR